MSKKLRISAAATVKEILNFAIQSDNEMDSDVPNSEGIDDLNGDTGVFNNYCITFTWLVKKEKSPYHFCNWHLIMHNK